MLGNINVLLPKKISIIFDAQTLLEEDFDFKGWVWYQPDGWVPHCTIALNSEDEDDIFYKTSELVLREFEKMSGKYTAIGLVKITFPVEEIATVDFELD